MSTYQVCTKCIIDNIDDDQIVFDKNGVCNHCLTYDENLKKHYYGDDPELKKYRSLIANIKREGKGKKYDVLIGLSGGVDSTYVAYLCKQEGLRALAIHLDNGWNSELSVVNIRNILKVTQYDLHTHVINWNEFKDMQKSYFKAHVVDIEALTDHAIGAIMLKQAARHGIKYILSGSSITTEGRLPSRWIFNKSDSVNIKAIHRQFGSVPISTFPLLGYPLRGWTKKWHRIQTVNLLDYLDYNKEKAKQLIQTHFFWRDYGGKHYESVFTRFYQAYILPHKFNIDKRKSHYSTLICAGQLSRNEALELMKEPIYPSEFMKKTDKEFVLKKLDFTEEAFERYIQAPEVPHEQYASTTYFLKKLSRIKRRLLFWK